MTIGVLLGAAALLGACPQFQQRGARVGPSTHRLMIDGWGVYSKTVGTTGPDVLFIHGYASAHDAWVRIAPELRRDHRLLLVDLPGFGRSDKLPGDYSPPAVARRLLALLDQQGAQRVDLVAHSWGSSIALSLALAAPERIRTVTLLSAWVFEEQLPPFFRWARAPAVGEALFALFYDQQVDLRMEQAFYDPEPFVQPAMIDRVKAALDRPGAVAAALAAARGQRFSDLQRRYPEVRQPTLLIWGREDRVSRLPYAHRLHRALPDAKLVVLAQCGHMPQLERPREVVRALRAFWGERRERP